MLATELPRLCADRGWSRTRLVLELRNAARRRGSALPGGTTLSLPEDDSLKRMVRQWISGDRGLSPMYADLLTIVFGMPFESATAEQAGNDEDASALSDRLVRVSTALDAELVELLEQQTQSFRVLDRRLGARRLLTQTQEHVSQMTDLLSYALCGRNRTALAEALAEGAALAGWQALDLGRPDKAWMLHETAKAAARDSGNAGIIAHVTAQQAYALLDLGRPADAVVQMRHARQAAGGRVPAALRAWLWAAEGEALAAAGEEAPARRALDLAAAQVAACPTDQLPYIFLDDVHLARWRGHSFALLGLDQAVTDLSAALAGLDPSFARARAGLHTDLALAYATRGERDAAHEHAKRAGELVEATTSIRQKRRLSVVLREAQEKRAG